MLAANWGQAFFFGAGTGGEPGALLREGGEKARPSLMLWKGAKEGAACQSPGRRLAEARLPVFTNKPPASRTRRRRSQARPGSSLLHKVISPTAQTASN